MLMAIVLLLTGIIAYSQQVQKVSPKGTQFHLYTPPGYSSTSGPYPLLVMLHGQGGIGDNLNLLLTHRDDIPAKLIAQNNWPSGYPFIVLTPLLERDESIPDPRDQLWPPELVDEVVEYVRSNYAVNQNKIYVTGLSLGAHGSYSYAAAFPEKVAAVVMVSGVPDTLLACQVKNIPIWTFHGSEDGLVDPSFATNMVRSIMACSPGGMYTPHLTMLYAHKHEGWNEIYNNSNGYYIYDWLLKFSKNDPGNTPPYVNAGNDFTIIHRDQPLHLYGEYFDSDGSVANVVWTKISGPEVTLDGMNAKFLKLSNITQGIYEFELTVTDNDGAQQSDRVQVNISGINASAPAVTGLILMNGSNQQDIADLSDGYVINPETLGTNEINIRATATGNYRSVRFKINSNHNAKTTNNAPYLLATPRWTVEEGDYLVCATPFTDLSGKGTAGISQCFKIVVSTEAAPPPPPPPPPPPAEEIKHFFAKPETDISLLSSWASNPDGTGTTPTSFSLNDQTFDIQTKSLLNNPLAIGGTGSVFRIKDGGELILNNSLTAEVNTEGNAVLHVNSNHTVTFGTLSALSTINFNVATTSIPAAHYGHLNLKGPESIKTLSAGITRVAGNLTIDDGVKLEGSGEPGSMLALSGDLNILENEIFEPGHLFSIVFEKGSSQVFNLKSPRAVFYEIVISPNTIVQLNGSVSKTLLELGSDIGGGLTVNSDGKFFLKKNDLLIRGKGGINSQNQSGQVGFGKSQLKIESSSDSDSHLYAIAGSDSVQNLIIDLRGGGELSIQRPLYIVDYVNTINGTTNSNGFLSLVSTAHKTARLLKPDGSGNITGDVVFQRFIQKGKQIRYISLPVAGVTVSDIQTYIPVTGSFSGSSTGNGLPIAQSLFYYDDTRSGWMAFPEVTNSETLTAGKGYSILITDAIDDTKLITSGPVHQGNFIYTLTANAENNPEKGWNLIGNPYASPIQWNQKDWITEGANTTAYLLDDHYPGGRFLVWDGAIGDEEFSGLITQGQGFFVRTTHGSPMLKITEDAKVDTSSSMFRQHKTKSLQDHFVVTLKQNALIDKAYVKFAMDASDNFDETDAVKRKNGYFSLSTLSLDSVPLAINNLTDSFCDRSIVLSLDETVPGAYTLAFEGSLFQDDDIEINLMDDFTNTAIKLDQHSPYNFQVTTDPASYGKKRFQIQMPSSTLEEPVISVEDNILTSNVSSGNQWLLDGEEIEGATEATYVPPISGEYRLRITWEGCSRISEPVSITVTVTDVYENKNKGLEFYPNPASEYIQIQSPSLPPSTVVYYSIINAVGMQIQKGEIESDVLMKGSVIDVQHFPSGIYFFMLRTTGWQYQAKFVID